MHLPPPLFDPATRMGDLEDRIRCYGLRKPPRQMEMFLEEFPKPGVPTSSYYWDLAPSRGYVSGCYTSTGIRDIDGAFAAMILRGRGHYTVEQVETMILANPHLHPVIKTNLLHNARTCLRPEAVAA